MDEGGHRGPVAGYPRGEETRKRIIQAAVELFGNAGFDRVSTREIASRARVRAPVLQYYFNGKEGLYLACIEQMRADADMLLQPVIDTVRKKLSARHISRNSLIACVCYIYAQAAGFLLLHSEHPARTRLAALDILWGDIDSGAVREVPEGSLRHQFRELLCELVGRIIGKSPEDEQTRLRVMTFGSQIAIFHHARQQSLADIGWTQVSERELKLLQSIILGQIEAALRAAGKYPTAGKATRKG